MSNLRDNNICPICGEKMIKRAGVVIDPFMGSGSTGIGAKLEGFSFIGIEKEEEYCKIAEARINAWQEEKPPKEIIEPTLF
jgi:site-specific DNA-methyltransferase (adenine-specific)